MAFPINKTVTVKVTFQENPFTVKLNIYDGYYGSTVEVEDKFVDTDDVRWLLKLSDEEYSELRQAIWKHAKE